MDVRTGVGRMTDAQVHREVASEFTVKWKLFPYIDYIESPLEHQVKVVFDVAQEMMCATGLYARYTARHTHGREVMDLKQGFVRCFESLASAFL